MGIVYLPPEGFKAPDIGKYTSDIQAYFKACEDYVKEIKRVVRRQYGAVCPEAGRRYSSQ